MRQGLGGGWVKGRGGGLGGGGHKLLIECDEGQIQQMMCTIVACKLVEPNFALTVFTLNGMPLTQTLNVAVLVAYNLWTCF